MFLEIMRVAFFPKFNFFASSPDLVDDVRHDQPAISTFCKQIISKRFGHVSIAVLLPDETLLSGLNDA